MKTSKQVEGFCAEARRQGALDAVVIAPRQVVTAAWVRLRCQYGCSEYGQCFDLSAALAHPGDHPQDARRVSNGDPAARQGHGRAAEDRPRVGADDLSGRLLQGVCVSLRAVLAVQELSRRSGRRRAERRSAGTRTWPGRRWRRRGSTFLPRPGRPGCPSRLSARRSVRRTIMPWCWSNEPVTLFSEDRS